MSDRQFDHGELNIPFSRRRRSIDSMIDAGLREIAKEKRAEHDRQKAAKKARREAEAARPKLTADDIRGTRYVRDQFGWHEVIRVNVKTVTVKTPYSWTETIPLPSILEARR